MKHLFSLIALVILFTQCKTIAPTTTTISTVEIRDTTIFLDDILDVQIPPDTLIFNGITPIIQDKTIQESKHFESDFISADIQITISGENVEWNIEAITKDTSFQVTEKDTVFIKDAIRNTSTETTIQPAAKQVKYIPAFYKFTFKYFWFTLAALGLFIGVRAWAGKIYSFLIKLIFKK